MQALAEPNTVVIADSTRALTRDPGVLGIDDESSGRRRRDLAGDGRYAPTIARAATSPNGVVMPRNEAITMPAVDLD